MRLFRRKPRSFDIQVHDLTLHISASPDLHEESRASALSFWEQLQAYALQNPDFRTSKRPLAVPAAAPEIVREMAAAAAAAGVGPMFTFRGALTDHVGRYLARSSSEVTVACDGDYHIVARKRRKLTVHQTVDGGSLSVVLRPESKGLGVATTLGRREPLTHHVDGFVVLATSCMLAEAAAAGVRSLVARPDGFRAALAYLQRIDGVRGGMLVKGEQIGVAGGVEIAA